MEDVLKNINAVHGVMGSFVCSNAGTLMASVLPDSLDEAALSAIGRPIVQTITGMAAVQRRKVGDIDLVYSHSRLIIKSLGTGCLCVLCARSINVPLLNLTVNVAAKKLTKFLGERVETTARDAAVQEAAAARTTDLNEEVRSFISAARAQGVVLRATGDTGIRLRCPNTDRIAPSSNGNESILDLASRAKYSAQINHILERLGYLPERRFNLLHGSQLLRFIHSEKKIGIEVFLDTLNSYHKLNFADRLDSDEETIPLADLLLWKLQSVETNDDCLRAICAIIHDHELGGPKEQGKIDTSRILELCTNDWGWYKTATINLEKCVTFSENKLGNDATVIIERTRRLLHIIDEAPKSGKWHRRALIGERVQWYETPE